MNAAELEALLRRVTYARELLGESVPRVLPARDVLRKLMDELNVKRLELMREPAPHGRRD